MNSIRGGTAGTQHRSESDEIHRKNSITTKVASKGRSSSFIPGDMTKLCKTCTTWRQSKHRLRVYSRHSKSNGKATKSSIIISRPLPGENVRRNNNRLSSSEASSHSPHPTQFAENDHFITPRTKFVSSIEIHNVQNSESMLLRATATGGYSAPVLKHNSGRPVSFEYFQVFNTRRIRLERLIGKSLALEVNHRVRRSEAINQLMEKLDTKLSHGNLVNLSFEDKGYHFSSSQSSSKDHRKGVGNSIKTELRDNNVAKIQETQEWSMEDGKFATSNSNNTVVGLICDSLGHPGPSQDDKSHHTDSHRVDSEDFLDHFEHRVSFSSPQYYLFSSPGAREIAYPGVSSWLELQR